MVIPLAGPRRLIFAVSVIVLVGAYLSLSGMEFAASHFASRPDLPSLERAVRLSPGNADYRARVGRYRLFLEVDPPAALENLESAVRLNPYDSGVWLDLASARQLVGDSQGQREAIEGALRAEPASPRVAWAAANFFVIDGEEQRALREFRVVIENDPSLMMAALQYCWRTHPDVDVLLHDAIPAQTGSLLTFLGFLMAKHETDGAIKVWDRVIAEQQKFEPRSLFAYVQYLIGTHRPGAAMAAWKQAAALLGLSAYLPTEDNLVINPDFSLDVLNAGFDWTYVNRNGVHPILDLGDFRQGSRSLSITFDGPGINDAGFQQLIPVRGGSLYNFSAYFKSTSFEGAGGPQIVLRDAYSGTPLFVSDPLTDADYWKEVHSQVTTPEATTLIALRIERFPAGSPIRGKLWLDNFELSPADPQEHP